MKLKKKENTVFGGVVLGLGIVGFVINYMKSRNVDKKVDLLGHHLNDNLNEFGSLYNKFLDFQEEVTNDMKDDIDHIKEEVGTCYEHIEVLSKQLDKEDKVEKDCNEVI